MSEQRILRHPKFDVAAPESYWTAANWTVYSNTETVGPRAWSNSTEADELIALGIAATGKHDESVLVWVMAETQRRKEEQTRVTALAREAEGLKALATSLATVSDQSVLDRILSRLSERTQYAVRAQLKGSGIGGL
jgi:hypothetical protein